MSSGNGRNPGSKMFGDRWTGHLRRRAERAAIRTTAAGAEAYVRERHLPRLIAIEPADLPAADIETQARLVARLANALRAERVRGRAGHWTYDLNRHFALKQAHTAERDLLLRLRRG